MGVNDLNSFGLGSINNTEWNQQGSRSISGLRENAASASLTRLSNCGSTGTDSCDDRSDASSSAGLSFFLSNGKTSCTQS